MTEILHAIGKPASLPRKLWLMSMFGCLLTTFLVLDHLVPRLLGVSPVVLEVVAWVVWFTWQGWLFGVHRSRYLRESPMIAYRRAFYHDILPGATFAVSQMMNPAMYGLRLPIPFTTSAPLLLVALVGTTTGATIMMLAFKTIGFGGAAFLNEFGYRGKEVSDWSIYKYIRHPLFLGAVLLSIGGASFTAQPLGLVMALVNVATLPVYLWLEDRRLLGLLGDSYSEYRARVGAFFPRLSSQPALADVVELDSELAA